jgi:uncharacterized membrane protein
MEPYLRISLVLEVLVVAAAIHLLAAPRHPRSLFGVHLGREKTDADLRLAQQVRWGNALVSLAAVSAMLLGGADLAIFALIAGSLAGPAVLLYGYVRLLKTIDRPQISGRYLVPLETHSARELVSVPLQLFNVALLAGTALTYAVLLPGLPERIPVHFGPSGQPDRFGSPHELWLILVLMIFYTAITWMVAWMSSSERMALAPDAPEETRTLQLMKRQITVRMTEWIMLGANVASAICWIGLAVSRESIGALVLITIVVATGSIIASLARHLGPLMEIADRLQELGADSLGTRADSWRWGGAIYYAPDDPALFVAKRSGVGTTINFGRPGAWLLLAGLLLAPVLIAMLFVLAPLAAR